MARLNIEDEFFIAVMSMVGPSVDVDKAMGNALRFIRLSQEKFKSGRVITELEFERLGFLPDLIGIFAEKVEGGYQANGANKFFSWLLDRSEAAKAGGIASAESRKNKYGSSQPNKRRTKPERPSNDLERPKQIEASSSLSYSSSLSSSDSTSDSRSSSKSTRDESRVVAQAPTKPNIFIAKYVEAWTAKHGGKCDIVGKDAGIAKRLAQSLSIDRAEFLIKAYFAMPDSLFFKAKHPLELFESRLKEIAAFADSGSFVTRRQASQLDDAASNMLLLEKVKRGAV